MATPEAFARDPARVWQFYSERRAQAAQAAPNPGHVALAALEERLGDRFLLATQNVDGLHRRAGSRRVVELHGQLFATRCSTCDRDPFEDHRVIPRGEIPPCDRCGGQLRPHIVWFGEMLDPVDLDRVEAFLAGTQRHPLVFIAAGTSGAVYPAAGMVNQARRAGAQTWLLNADPADNGHLFDHFVQGRSGQLFPKWFKPRP